MDWLVLDHFQSAQMTEASLRRARRLFPTAQETVAAAYDHWPADSGAAEVVLGFLAIHELRSVQERSRWFGEAKRCVRPAGKIILVEHVRDLANFVAFGPGFLHFHSAANWRHAWEAAGLHLLEAFRITPWVRVIVLGK